MEKNVETVDLGNDGLRPHPLAEGQQQATRNAGYGTEQAFGFFAKHARFLLEAAQQVHAGAADQQGEHATGGSGGKCREKVNAPRRIGMAVETDAMEDPLEEPGQQGPDRIAGRVRYAEIVRCHDQLARVFKSEGWLQGQGVDNQGNGEGHPAGDPVRFAEKLFFIQNRLSNSRNRLTA